MVKKRPFAIVGLLAAALLPGLAPVSAEQPIAYRIGIEDVLGIVVWDEPTLSVDAQVRPDGRITVPLLNDVTAIGATPEELATKLSAALEQFVTAPNVTVIVRQINSYKVYFLGEVTSQGEKAFYRPTRLLQGIASAGGLTQFSNDKITLLREVGGVEKRYQINYKKLFTGDPTQENIVLLPNDTLLFH